ncbi:MAG: PQQ-binding-like beta-propeller repeat protein [Phycisphaerae bacterium]|jgi:outer membrane protein assembly factor BamB/SAM-dependent methyltransferase|nr:PQQ-binding-like beta-propeller repeat protein [Phycisphaerae bacterium]
MKKLCGYLIVCLAVVIGSATLDAAELTPADALKASGVKGGLVVHLGCGDGKLTASLRANDSGLVHGLDSDAKNISAARERIAKANLSGKVTFDVLRSDSLPYIDNLVNLIVAEDLGNIPPAEAMRVLRPGGVLQTRKGDKWTARVKPRPKEIDDWTHFLHSASGNAVSNDTVVAPPRHMQWLAAPVWSRNHHKLASISSIVTRDGRLFYIMDSGPSANMSVIGKWSLVARDAFNGVKLWSKPMATWAHQGHGFRNGPVQLPRTLVVGPKCVYAPLEMSAAVSAVEVATGKVIHTYKETAGAEELILIDDTLLVVSGAPMAEQAGIDPSRRGAFKFPNVKTIRAIRAETGKLLWKWSDEKAGALMPLTLAAADNRVFFKSGNNTVCLDLPGGKQIWSSGQATADPKKKKGRKSGGQRRVGWSLAALTVSDGVVLLADGGRLQAFSAKDGKYLWHTQAHIGLCRSPSEMFVIDSLVWQGPHFKEGRDIRTGKIQKSNTAAQDIWTAGHHHRCYRQKATSRYILTGYRGIEFFDIFGKDHTRNNWIRGMCQYGIMPANGLIYAPSHACGCFMEAKLRGFWAAAPQRKEIQQPTAPQLQKGPAYGLSSKPKSQTPNPKSNDWPTYRGDALRSGSTTAKLPAAVKNAWRTEIGGRITPPVVAGGLVIVASIDTHRVIALSADDGKQKWTYSAGGRVDSPPTIHNGLVLFGSADGWVYCLSASDGREIWRFRVAPHDRRTIALDQIESVWPVHGSVLVENGLAYASAGRSSHLDGGIYMIALDPITGKKVHESIIRTGHPTVRDRDKAAADTKIARKGFSQNATDHKTFTDPDRSDAFSMGGSVTDVLVSDGTYIYMHTVRFDRKCVRQDTHGRHIFSTTALLDGAENHRSHIAVGTGDFSRTPVAYSWIANRANGAYGSRLSVPYGLMLSYDAGTVWGVKRPGRNGGSYQLFAQQNTPFSPNDKHMPDFRPTNDKTTPPQKWSARLPMRPRAMLRTGDMIFLGGMSAAPVSDDPHATFEGRAGGMLRTASAVDGKPLAHRKLKSPPVWDGLAAAGGKLYMSAMDGSVTCMDHDDSPPPIPAMPAEPARKPGPKRRRGAKSSPGKPVAADKAGKFVLTPATAKTTGGLRYNAQRNNLGSWMNPKAFCQWTLKGVKAGAYSVEFAYGSTNRGVGYTIIAGDRKLSGKTEHTGGIRTYKSFKIGTITLTKGKATLAVKPGAFKGAIMNLRLLTLTPVK